MRISLIDHNKSQIVSHHCHHWFDNIELQIHNLYLFYTLHIVYHIVLDINLHLAEKFAPHLFEPYCI